SSRRSMRLASQSCGWRVELPHSTMSGPSPALTFFNSSMLCSAWVLAHAYVVVPRVITYLFAFVITGPIGSLADACGQWAAQMSYVLRPSNTSFGLATVPINRMTAAPDVWSEYFTAHPPRSKPPL